MDEIVLLHTSDLHGALTAAAAQRLSSLKARHGALLLDGGDATRIWNITNMPWPLAPSALMKEAGYDAVGLGNREFCFRARCLSWARRTFSCPLVATNLQVPPAAGLEKVVFLRQGEVSVAVLALVRRMIAPDSWVQALSNVRWLAPGPTLRELLPAVREEADWIVVLSHLGHEEDLRLAAEDLDLDVLLGGHDHILTPRGVLGLRVPVVYSGWRGRWVSLVCLARAYDGVKVQVEAVPLS